MSNLIDITTSDDTETVYSLNMGCIKSDLTSKELALLEQSEKYLSGKAINRNEALVKSAYVDFEKLSKIENMPIESLQIISQWVHVDGFDEDDD